MLAVVAPGQGSQSPGFLRPWLEVPGVADRLTRMSDVTGIDLVALGTDADADTIRDTAVAQPLIVAAGLATAPAIAPEAFSGEVLAGDVVVAGHSVGELTAAALAGVITAEEALGLVSERGRAMAAAAAQAPTGMSAVLGGDAEEVAAILDKHGLTPANLNGAGQVVAAGTHEQLAALAAEPPSRARVMPLQVAGAFHTEHMAPAVAALASAAARITPADPAVTLLSNADGEAVTSGADVLRRLVAQVSRPVRWDLCVETLRTLGVTALLELPPAGALANLAKRGLRGVDVVAVRTPDDLDAARALAGRHRLGGVA